MMRIGIILVGVVITAFAMYQRNVLGEARSVYPIIGIALIILGVVTFFFGEKEAEEIAEEEPGTVK